jgi:streptogramin lyase
MSQDFTTRLQLQLREAALRDERRGSLGRWVADLRRGVPAPAATAAVALAALLVALVVALGGLRWGGGDVAVSHPKVIADVPLADNLGFMAAGFGSVWVADTKTRTVLRVDPATHKVQARVARHPGTDGGHRVLRIDPATNRITARVELPADQAPMVSDVQIVDGRPWAITFKGAIELDPQTARPGRFVRIAEPGGEPFPLGIMAAEGELWVLTRGSRIDRYSLASGQRTASRPVRLSGVTAVVPTPDGPLYVTSDGQLARADADGRIAWQRRLGTSVALPLVIGKTAWVHASDTAGGRDRLVEVDIRSGHVRSSTGLPEFGVSGMTLAGRDLWLGTQAGKVQIVRR